MAEWDIVSESPEPRRAAKAPSGDWGVASETADFSGVRSSGSSTAKPRLPPRAGEVLNYGDPLYTEETISQAGPWDTLGVPDYRVVFPEKVQRDVGLGESIIRGLAQGGERFQGFANLLLGMPIAKAVDLFREGSPTQDAVGRMVQENYTQAERLAINPQLERQGFGSEVGQAVASFAPDLAAAIATGGESAVAQAVARPVVQQSLGRVLAQQAEQALATGARASIVPGAERGTEVSKNVADAGGSLGEALGAGATAALATALTNAIPASASGSVLARAAQGAVSNPVADIAQTYLENAAIDDRLGLDQATDAKDLIVSAIIGAPLAAGIGERGAERLNDPEAMRRSAAPDSAWTPISEAPIAKEVAQDQPDPAAAPEPTTTPPAAATSAPEVPASERSAQSNEFTAKTKGGEWRLTDEEAAPGTGIREVVAYDGDKPIGSLLYASDGTPPTVNVEPEYQRKGVATAMLKLAKERGGVLGDADTGVSGEGVPTYRTEEGQAFRAGADEASVTLAPKVVDAAPIMPAAPPAAEAPAPPPVAEAPAAAQPKATGTKNAVMELERSREGRDPIIKDAARTNAETLATAAEALKSNPRRGEEIVSKLRSQGPAAISVDDEAALLLYKTQLRNDRDDAAKVLGDPNASEEAREVAQKAWDRTESQINDVDQATYASGREWGRLGQFRQRMLREDFTLEAMERRLRATAGKPLTAKETEQVATLSKRITELEERVAKSQERIDQADSIVTYNDLLKTMQVEYRKAPKQRPTLDKLRAAADASRAALAKIESVPSRKGQSGAVIDPTAFFHLSRIGAYHIANGITKFADWVNALRADIGDRIDTMREALPQIFQAAKLQSQAPVGPGESPEAVRASIQGEPTAKDVRRLTEAFIRDGIRGEPAIVKSVSDSLGIEPAQVRQLLVQSTPRARTVNEARDELRDLRSLIRIQNEIDRLEAGAPKAPKGQAPQASPAVQAKRQELDAVRKRLQAQARPDEETRYQDIRGKDIQRQINVLEARIKAGDFEKRVRVPRELNAANQKAQFELFKAKEEFERLRYEAEMEKRTPVQKIFGGARDVINLARAYMTSVDFSGLLRQGGFISYGHPIRAAKASPAALKSFGSEKAEFQANQEIENRENYRLYKKYGLELTGIGAGPLSKVEEAYATRLLNKVPRLLGGGIVLGSGRAYTVLLNRLRADSFDAMIASLAKDGSKPTEEEGKAIANYINVATGRGKVGSSNNAGEALNTVFFAPRLVASRFQLLAGQPLYGGTAKTRKLIVQEYARFLIGVSIAIALAAQMKDEDDETPLIGLDPRSSDFGKIRFGQTYLDPLAGLAQVTTFVSRTVSGENRNSKGELVPLRNSYRLTDYAPQLGDGEPLGKVKYGGTTGFDVLANFMRSKLAPVPGAIVNTAQGSNMIGEPVSPGETALSLVTPMSFGNIQEIMEEQGITRGSAITMLGLLGMGVQYRKTKEQREAEQAEREAESGR